MSSGCGVVFCFGLGFFPFSTLQNKEAHTTKSNETGIKLVVSVLIVLLIQKAANRYGGLEAAFRITEVWGLGHTKDVTRALIQ